MNFIKGRLEEANGVVSFKATNIDIALPEGRAKLVRDKGYVGKEVILGVRPEDIHNEPIFLEASPNSAVNAYVDVVENLGHEIILYLSGIGDGTTVARVDARNNVADGSNIKLAIDMNKIHLFDPTTELTITE
jgi:multiple sugar transport system ATP-binding protein